MKYVAFLRGINNIGGNFIKMDALKREFGSLGFKNVKTVLASGNVIFETAKKDELKLSEEISTGLEKLLKRRVTVVIRTIDSIVALYDNPPFKNVKMTENTKNTVTFVPDPKKSLSKPRSKDFKILSASNGAVCATYELSNDIGTRDFMQLMEKECGKEVTTRFWDTIVKIVKASS